MLTHKDLSAIRSIVIEVVDDRLAEQLEIQLGKHLEKQLDDHLDKRLKKELQPIWKELRKIRRDLHTTTKYFDNEVWLHGKRITRIEDHLHLQPIET